MNYIQSPEFMQHTFITLLLLFILFFAEYILSVLFYYNINRINKAQARMVATFVAIVLLTIYLIFIR